MYVILEIELTGVIIEKDNRFTHTSSKLIKHWLPRMSAQETAPGQKHRLPRISAQETTPGQIADE